MEVTVEERDHPHRHKAHITLAPATALALLVAISGVILSYGNLQTRLITAEEQLRGLSGNHFTDKDFARERALFEKSLLEERVRTEADIERARLESMIICESLSALARDIGKNTSLRCPVTFRDADGSRTR